MVLNISHKCITVREEIRTDVIIVKTIFNQETNHLVETEMHLIEVEEILEEIIDQITVVGHKTISEMITDRAITGMTTDEIIIEITTDKTIKEIIIEIKGLEIGIEVEVGMDIEIITESSREEFE